LFYVSIWEGAASVFRPQTQTYVPGQPFRGGRMSSAAPVPDAAVSPSLNRPPINTWTDATGHGAVVALDPDTGQRRWTFRMYDLTDSGVLTTASDVLFTGGREGYFYALDARTGSLLWKSSLGGPIRSGPVAYEVDGQQFVATIAGGVLAAFALRE
jgi:alcohol dehydrogenase (cytochrome c)